MKVSRVVAVVSVALLLVFALFWWLPARWVKPALDARLHGLRLDAVSGSLWRGQAGSVLGPDGKSLGALRWELSRAVLWGDLKLSFDLNGPGLAARGSMHGSDAQAQVWEQVHLSGDARFFARRFGLPDGYLEGQLQADIGHAELQGNWPLALDGTAQWKDGVLTTRAGKVRVGDLHAAASGAEGVVDIRLNDDGTGPLALDGHWQLSPLGWRVDMTAQARSGDPVMQQWLRTLGKPDTSGVIHIQRNGGVAGALATKGKS